MNDHDGKQKSEAELECEIRQGRTFSPQEALARMAGPGAMKGASPVSPVQQAETEIMCWLGAQLSDATGALPTVLHRQIRGSERLLDNLHQPLVAVAGYCRHVLAPIISWRSWSAKPTSNGGGRWMSGPISTVGLRRIPTTPIRPSLSATR